MEHSKYRSENVKTIREAFKNFVKNKDRVIEAGMCRLLDAALDYLHDAHEMQREGLHHENESNTLGWALVHNGQIVEAVSQSKGPYTPKGDALKSLEEIASTFSTGWVGIVLSDMKNGWYRVDWEVKFLNYSSQMTAQTFDDYFKPI